MTSRLTYLIHLTSIILAWSKISLIRRTLSRFIVTGGLLTIQMQPCYAESTTVPFTKILENKLSGIDSIDNEVLRVYRKARQVESDGDFKTAQNLYEQVVVASPEFVTAWSNLGNVLTAEGNLEQALLCYKKALSLFPPADTMSIIFLNKASIEISLGNVDVALRDLSYAEKLAGPKPEILTNKAVVLSNNGRWEEANAIFERVISSADKNALPWWLRYSMSLLETNRGMEAVAYYQRTLNRFPDEVECKAFGGALYTSLGSKQEGLRYWRQIPIEYRKEYEQLDFVKDKLKWGPKAVDSFKSLLEYDKITSDVVLRPTALV